MAESTDYFERVYKDAATGNHVVPELIGGSQSVKVLAYGGSAGTDISSFPHTLATHTASGAGTTYNLTFKTGTVQATTDFDGGSALTATITIQVSNDNDQWITLGTISLSGDNDTEGFVFDAPWAYIRSNATAFSATGSTPKVTVTMSA